jgi:hypothetical protein
MIEDEDNDDDSYIGQSSTSCLKRPSDGFSTRNRCYYQLERLLQRFFFYIAALKRSYNKAKTTSQSNQRFIRGMSFLI